MWRFYAAAYLICGNVRIGVCLGMAISMIHGMIDHYVMLFRGTPVMLSDIAAIGTAANVSKGYSAPMELSVLRAAAAVLFCVSVCLMQRSFQGAQALVLPQAVFAAVRARAGVHRLHRHQTVGTGLAFWQSSRQYSEIFYFLRCATGSFVKQPEGYNADALSATQSEFTGKQGTKTPNLIVIMNESFSDLGSVGALETNEDPMPYIAQADAGSGEHHQRSADRFDLRRRHRQLPSWNSSPAIRWRSCRTTARRIRCSSKSENAQSDLGSGFARLPDGGDSPLSVHLVEPHERLPLLRL